MSVEITPAELKKCAAFSRLSDDECRTLAPLLQREIVAAGETVLTLGHTTQALWVVREGQCDVVKLRADGQSTTLATLEAGSVFGEMSFFDGAPHSASVVASATSDVSLYWLSKKSFDKLEETSPELTQRITLYIARLLSERLRKMDEWVSSKVESPDARYKKEWLEFRNKLFT